MNSYNINQSLELILSFYQDSFQNKIFEEELSQEDDLMRIFGITYEVKVGNRQYWGRQLGACWERLVKEVCRSCCDNFKEPENTTYDLAVGLDAIDTKSIPFLPSIARSS